MKTNVFVKTKNVKRFVGLMEDLKKLPPNIPKLALVYGDHGIGKTKTLLWWATKNDAIYIRANNDITQNGLLKIIMEELEISPFHSMQDNFNAILKQLRTESKIIIVDEVDYLIGYKNAIEILRDIQDNTGSPIILSGMGMEEIMNYLLIENEQLVGVCDYEPNIGDDDIQVITYSGNIPPERIIYVDGKVADMDNYVFINGKYVKKTRAIENLLNTNDEAKHYLNDTDWLVIRHRDQLALGQTTSLTNEQYLDLLTKRQAARERVVEYGE